jgi:hypothetical protein
VEVKVLGVKYGRNPEARVLQHLVAHHSLFWSSATGCAGLATEKGKRSPSLLFIQGPVLILYETLPMSNMSLS